MDPALANGGSTAVQRARLASRLTVAFVLDIVAVVRGDGHILDALLLSTIVQANVAPISQQGDLQVAFSEFEEVPPDALRRPISINALASSLGLPFETVRRRVRGMARNGWCAYVEGGVVVPAAVLASPEYLRRGLAAYERFRAFYHQLRDADLLGPLPPPTVVLKPGAFPLRAVARLGTDYVLRVIEAMMKSLDEPLDGLLLFEILRGNTEHLPAGLRGGDGLAADDFVPDALRRPVRLGAAARRLGAPQETARRHLQRLLERGLCQKVRGGYIVPADALARPAFARTLGENLANLHRLFGGLSQLGVLAIWDAMGPAAAAPAVQRAAE